jgi:hypothetical protein
VRALGAWIVPQRLDCLAVRRSVRVLAGRDLTAWLAFLNTVRTERFDQVLALRPLLATFAKAA